MTNCTKEITITGWQSEEELAVIAMAMKLAEFFIKNGHSAQDLKSAILTTMNINLEDGWFEKEGRGK